MITDRHQVRRVRVLSIPGRRHAQDSYYPLLWDALEAEGAEMISARTLAALTLKYDILQLHFPDHLVTEKSLPSAVVAAPLFLAYVAAAKIAGKRLVWTVHEVYPKRRRWLARPYLWCIRMLTNAYVFMNRTSENEFVMQYPSERQKTIWRLPLSPHPVAKLPAGRRSDVRMPLTKGADCLLFGFLGQIRPYKNPDALQYLPKTDFQDRPFRLVVAGSIHASCKIDHVQAILRAIEPDRLLRIGEREGLSDERLAELIQSVDIVFVPYLSGWNSGFAMFALGCGARLLCSALPMFREFADALGVPWVYVFDHTAADLSQELTTAVARISRDRPGPSDEARLEQFLADCSFERAASRYLELYIELLGRCVAPVIQG
jgi:glycosyltransferase involved in cell wall biosynthesis